MNSTHSQVRLLILGASVRAAAESAAKAGYDVLAADQFADRDLREVFPSATPHAYPEGLVEFAQKVPPSAWLYTGGLENHPEIVEAISQRHELLGNGLDVLRKVRDPQELAAFARSHGYHFPETRFEPPRDDRTWLTKRVASGGGLGVRFAKSGARLAEGECYQEWIDGIAGSAAFLASSDETHFLFGSEQIVDVISLGAPKFHYAGNVVSLPLDDSPLKGIDFARLGKELAKNFGLRGLFGVDWILRRNAFWLLEINPRYTASMELLERAAHRSLIEEHVRACRNESLDDAFPSQSERAISIKAILYSLAEGHITDRMSDRLWTLRNELDLADLPMGNSAIPKGSPVLTIFAQGSTRSETMQQLQEKTETLRALGIP